MERPVRSKICCPRVEYSTRPVHCPLYTCNTRLKVQLPYTTFTCSAVQCALPIPQSTTWSAAIGHRMGRWTAKCARSQVISNRVRFKLATIMRWVPNCFPSKHQRLVRLLKEGTIFSSKLLSFPVLTRCSALSRTGTIHRRLRCKILPSTLKRAPSHCLLSIRPLSFRTCCCPWSLWVLQVGIATTDRVPA